MVWYNGGSPLYDAVERHNKDTTGQVAHEPPQNENVPHCAPVMQTAGVPETLFKDRDALLIAVMLLILMHEKADKKLILALAFVLFS